MPNGKGKRTSNMPGKRTSNGTCQDSYTPVPVILKHVQRGRWHNIGVVMRQRHKEYEIKRKAHAKAKREQGYVAFTLVQDERYGWQRDIKYALSVQVQGVLEMEIESILKLGGVVFSNEKECTAFGEMCMRGQNRIGGSFPSKLINTHTMYRPSPRERVEAGLPAWSAVVAERESTGYEASVNYEKTKIKPRDTGFNPKTPSQYRKAG